MMGSGGFDHGTTVGKNKLQMDLTLNPFDVIDFGQTYVVVSFGLEDDFDLHGYFSHHANGTNQFYYGGMSRFMEKKYLDLSTAIGVRHTDFRIDIFFPQILYTIKMNKFNIGGSFVNVAILRSFENLGTTFDIAIFFPIEKLSKKVLFIEKIELGMGFFRNLGRNIYPTYSVDMKFDIINK
ncbi:MAG: hypothetical protein VX820_00580 [Candidatus Neomarinimicrobiota bacterium]|nr:hypothetical protein [Candidatus Neomarinimicrobiota bacterium]